MGKLRYTEGPEAAKQGGRGRAAVLSSGLHRLLVPWSLKKLARILVMKT